MWYIRCPTAVLLLVLYCGVLHCEGQTTTDERVQKLEQISQLLAKELMMEQFKNEERVRAQGDSGLVGVRFRFDGPKSYYGATHASWSIASIHDHPEFERMNGMGEITAVLNGVQFKTRHNDYTLVMPAVNNGSYHAVENIPYPGVPPEVTNLATVPEQVEEMREWFRAWRDDNITHRDYRPYFRPNLCYLEGAWTTDVENIDEPFDSIRHQIDADTWEELFDRTRFMALTGDKSLLENLAHLPSMLLNVTDGIPYRAQWNYRILCHPITGDIKLSDFVLVDDLGNRMAYNRKWETYFKSRAARFALSPSSITELTSKLDEIMAQIPGKNNYGAEIIDNTLTRTKLLPKDDSPLNVAYYHRRYKLLEKGAMGDNTLHRGFNDRNLYVAENTQPRVAPFPIKLCKYPHRNEANAECENIVKRVSYAIPLEIVFQTPLQSWNPYNLEYKGDCKSESGLTVSEGIRSGKMTPEEAYNGINNRFFYMTPVELFTSGAYGEDRDTADTTRNSVGVLDRDGITVREVSASGNRIFTQEMGDLGQMRLRYPIMPLYMEGSSIYKEVEALRDLVLDMQGHLKYFYTSPGIEDASSTTTQATTTSYKDDTVLVLVTSVAGDPPHFHTFEVNDRQYSRLTSFLNSQLVNRTSSVNEGQEHLVTIGYDEDRGVFTIDECDGQPQCPDGHRTDLDVLYNFTATAL